MMSFTFGVLVISLHEENAKSYVTVHPVTRTARWCSGYGVGLVIGISRVRFLAGALPGSLGQLSLPSIRGR